jgi:hypothetical protein
MLRIPTLFAFLFFTGCVVTVQDDNHHEPAPLPPVEEAPFIEWADAGCEWSPYDGDFSWWFEADVFDSNGLDDVASVYADVMDWEGHWVDSFALAQDLGHGLMWSAEWLERSTWLDCRYSYYTVEFLAYDWLGGIDVLAVIPLTY